MNFTRHTNSAWVLHNHNYANLYLINLFNFPSQFGVVSACDIRPGTPLILRGNFVTQSPCVFEYPLRQNEWQNPPEPAGYVIPYMEPAERTRRLLFVQSFIARTNGDIDEAERLFYEEFIMSQ